MEYINISHKKCFTGVIENFSSELSNIFSADNIVSQNKGYWCSEKKEQPGMEYLIIDYGEKIIIDNLCIMPSANGAQYFPSDFRIEISEDGELWNILHLEKEYELENPFYELFLGLTSLRYLKIVITGLRKNDNLYCVEMGKCNVSISGIRELSVSSTASEKNDKNNLLDENKNTFWESAAMSNSTKESVYVDLGNVYHINRVVLGSSENGFPEHIYIEASTDNDIWKPLFEERAFRAESYKNYFWDMDISPVRFLRIELVGVKGDDGRYSVKLSQLLISAASLNLIHTHNIGELTHHASIFQAGIVRLGKDGEDTQGTVVQSGDRRLRDATTIFKGIVQLAEDGEEREGYAVQSSDMRLKQADELRAGIVRLGYDRENKSGAAVQGNDSRLKEATESSFGIVKLCSDGQYAENSVVRGNDSRIQKSTSLSYGICRLAENGENTPNTVVQADDKRLRQGSTIFPGIVQLAEDGEEREGVVVQGNDKRLKDATTLSKGIVELAEDGEESEGVAVQGNDRRLKDATESSKGIVELAEDGEEKPGTAVQGNDRRLKDATESTPGIMRFGTDGENLALAAVQGNDRRLKDATESTPGIMRFGSDGEKSALAAVQGNDKRLKDATTSSKGIVELAEDGEENEGVAVQGNDRRLKDATESSKGIVELAEDGEEKPGTAVQGNDRRLKDATESTPGIMRFGSDGESSAFAAVQGNDKRLRDATTVSKGIVELAEDGEDCEGVAIQGNDRRLRDATTVSKGIVELAEDGEEKSGTAVQGNDRRLKEATEETSGIVRLAKNNETRPGFVIQADDPRLRDKREPCPHEHDYASKDHDFNSHKGTLAIRDSKCETFVDITPPDDNSVILYGHNSSSGNGAIGVAGVALSDEEKTGRSYGVVGHSRHVGVRGQSQGDNTQKGCGVIGVSRFGAGGVFASEHDFSLVVEGYGQLSEYDSDLTLVGNGKGLLVRGESEFDGPVNFKNSHGSGEFPLSFVEMFEVDEVEFISPGDILSVSDEGNGVLTRSRREYSRSVIGVVAGNPVVSIDNSGTEKGVYPVALAGRVMCKVDARNNPVNPGDLIVAANTPGCGMSGKIDSFEKIGTVIGKALDRLDKGIGVIPVFITHK